MTQRWVAAWWLAMSVWSGTAHAQSIDLAWEAPSPCPTQAELLARVMTMVSQSAVADVSIRAVGQVKSKKSGYVLNLRLEQHERSAVRTLHDGDCASLSEAAAFLIAVAIDPTLPPPPPPPGDAPPAPTDTPQVEPDGADQDKAAAPAAPTPQAPPQTADQPAPDDAAESGGAQTTLTLHLGLFGGAWFGGLAGPQPALGLWAGAELGAVELWLSLAHHFARTRSLSIPGAESRFDGQEAAVSACYVWGERLQAGPCLRLAALRTHGSVSGVTVGSGDSRFWTTAGAALAVRYRVLGSLQLQLSGGAWVPLVARPRFEVDGLGSVGSAAPIGAGLQLGATVGLP